MTMRYEITINRPPADVFVWLDDSQRAKQWLTGLVEITPITSSGNRVGARAKHLYRENGRTFEMEEETLIYKPDEHVKIRGNSDGFEMTAEYRLTSAGSQTVLHFESTMRFKNFILRILSPLLMRGANQQTEKDFQKLKSLVEAS